MNRFVWDRAQPASIDRPAKSVYPQPTVPPREQPCVVCGTLTTRLVQSGNRMVAWCEKHEVKP